MNNPEQVNVRPDESVIDEHNKVFSQHESRVRRAGLRPTIVTKVLNAQEAKEIGEKLKQRPVSDALQIEKRDDASPPSEGMAP
jgi:hypothetical protein